VLAQNSLPGQTVLVDRAGGGDSLTLRKVLGPTRFSIGDEDLRVGGGPVNEVIPAESRIVTSVSSPHAVLGMTVLNGRGQVQGRLAKGEIWTLDRQGLPPLRSEDFPAGQNGLGPRFAVVIAGPGDELVFPSLLSYEAKR
jgi:hypothetical protein